MTMQDFPEDQSILSAYLDGELDFELRQVVESCLASDPRLVDKLRELMDLRDLLAGTGRPKSIDLSREVLDEIHRLETAGRGNGPWKFFRFASIRSPRGLAGVGVAAGVLVLILSPVAFRLRLVPMDKGAVRAHPNREVRAIGPQADSRVEISNDPQQAMAKDSDAVAFKGPVQAPPEKLDQKVADPGPGEDAARSEHFSVARSEDARERVRRLLDDPSLHRVFIVADQIEGATADRISNLIERSVQDDYFSITVAQGVVIDPEHPSQAKVFAFALSGSEVEVFRKRLGEAIGAPTTEVEARPELVAQLSEIGRVEAYSPPAAGDIMIPRAEVALKSRTPERIPNVEDVQIIAGVEAHNRDSTDSSRTSAPTGRAPVAASGGSIADSGADVRSEDLQVSSQRMDALPSSSSIQSVDGGRRDGGAGSQPQKTVVLVWIRPPAARADGRADPIRTP